jgi:hypothetical protein
MVKPADGRTLALTLTLLSWVISVGTRSFNGPLHQVALATPGSLSPTIVSRGAEEDRCPTPPRPFRRRAPFPGVGAALPSEPHLLTAPPHLPAGRRSTPDPRPEAVEPGVVHARGPTAPLSQLFGASDRVSFHYSQDNPSPRLAEVTIELVLPPTRSHRPVRPRSVRGAVPALA